MRLPVRTDGLLRAIEAERRKARLGRCEGVVYHVEPIHALGDPTPTHALLYLQNEPKAKKPGSELDERFEGGTAVVRMAQTLPVRANASKQEQAADRNGNLRYTIVEVNANNLEVLVELEDRTLPLPNQQVTLYEPDFLAALEEWARELLPTPVFEQLRTATGAHLDPKTGDLVVPTPCPIRLLWGPPGTGKTYVLGERLADAWQRGERCCAIAPSHVAADQLALSTGAALERRGWHPQPGVVLRFGQRMKSAQTKLPRHLTMDSDELAALREEAADLRQSLRLLKAFVSEERQPHGDKSNAWSTIAEIHKELSEIQRKIRETEESMVKGAPIVICTAHAFAMHEAIHGRREDRKFVDESSMVPLAFVARFLDRMPRCATFGGDFLQLPPVVQANEHPDARRWFGTDIFASFTLPHASVARTLETDGTMEMLTAQRRMRPEICQYISNAFYGGRLSTVGSHSFTPTLVDWPTEAFLWVDPSLLEIPDTTAYPTWGKGCQWDRSARVASEWARVATHVLPSAQVAAITPWRSQEDLLRRLLAAEIHQQTVKVGTVHKLQGQEADIVVFDVVNATHGPLKYDPERIVNVAVSRARKQVIVVATRRMIQSHPLLSSMPLPAEPMAWPPSVSGPGLPPRTL
ncbi:MAG: AAA domain-containing protein [Fimbriimonadales bacterium]|nr:AAA domain-containing protein [Fimbriimonadales bacterium]